MNSAQIRIEKIKLKALPNFARAFFDRAKPEDMVPISRQRIMAQSHNPCAQPDDIVLLLALSGDTCIGYHGLLPGLLRHHGRLSKVYWATTFYVSAAFRGRGIGGRLIKKIKSCHIDFAVTGMTPGAEKTYLSAGLNALGPIVFYQLRMERVIRYKLLSRLAKGFIYRYWLSRQPPDLQQVYYKRVDQINTERKSNGVSATSVPVFYRDTATVNWMLKYPWVLSRNTAKVCKEKENYHFAVMRDVFEYVALEVYCRRDKALKGFLVLSVARKKGKTILKMLDYDLQRAGAAKIISGLSLKLAARYSADRIDIPAEFNHCFQYTFLHKKVLTKKKRSYLYHAESKTSPLYACADRIALNYCDGDTAFT